MARQTHVESLTVPSMPASGEALLASESLLTPLHVLQHAVMHWPSLAALGMLVIGMLPSLCRSNR